jgi:Acyl-protein synthetase, LuxE
LSTENPSRWDFPEHRVGLGWLNAVLPRLDFLSYNPDTMETVKDEIYDDVLAFIRRPTASGFEPLALKVYAYQFARNPAYQRYCHSKLKTPDTVGSWRDIPAVPTDAFKEIDLACGPPEKVFLTSGTSQGPSKRGRHGIPRLEIYHVSALLNFSAHLLPDLAALKMLILAGSPQIWPESSLAHMLETIRAEYGSDEAPWFVTEKGLDSDRLAAALIESCRQERPVMLLGVTLAFHQFLEHARSRKISFRLPPGSRIMDTGGFKGRKFHLSKTELYRAYEDGFGIPQSHIVNEYGMSEMCSQFYDNVLIDSINPPSRPRQKRTPPWVRTLVMDPETLQERPSGSPGILRHYDLANCGSVLALQTDDVGRTIGDGFEVIGRSPAAESRGCSLIIEELLRAR